MNLGTCCTCGITGKTVCNIVMLGWLSPEPGHGWGCIVCGLENNGAIAVLCDACVATGEPPKTVCVGFPYENRRIPLDQLTERYRHDPAKHNELEMPGQSISALLERFLQHLDELSPADRDEMIRQLEEAEKEMEEHAQNRAAHHARNGKPRKGTGHRHKAPR